MLVATQPYGNVDFEYPEIILNPFKASNVSVIPQSEALKAWEEEDAKKAEELEKQAEKEAKQAEKEAKRIQKEVQQQLENAIVKPDTVKTSEILQQTLTPIKKKEAVKTIEVKTQEERVEAPVVDTFAPIPMSGGVNN